MVVISHDRAFCEAIACTHVGYVSGGTVAVEERALRPSDFSCDDTGVAVVRSDGTILGEALASQAELHEEWGGVMPSVARDAHAEALERTAAEALDRAGMSSAAEVDAIAVTVGPGLEICLRVGCARLLLCLRQAYICTTTTTPGARTAPRGATRSPPPASAASAASASPRMR